MVPCFSGRSGAGREVIGTFFLFPPVGTRSLDHEFHSLSLSVLEVVHPGKQMGSWVPERWGIALTPLAAAPSPPAPPPCGGVQSRRALSRGFSALTTADDKGRRWELRLLPQPLYRYQSSDPKVLDGAVFAFVTFGRDRPGGNPGHLQARPRRPVANRSGMTRSAGSPT